MDGAVGQRTQPEYCWPDLRLRRRVGRCRPVAGLQPLGDGADEPGVHREALAAGGVLDAGLELLRQPEGDAGGRRPSSAVGGRRGAARGRRVRVSSWCSRRRRRGDDEADVTAAQPDVDRPGRELAGDLLGGGGEGAQQGQAQGRLERAR